MQVVIVLVLLAVAFVLGVIMGPAVESGANMADQMGQARDAMGMCGGSNPCAETAAEGDMAPDAPATEEPMADEPSEGDQAPAEEMPAAEPPPQ